MIKMKKIRANKIFFNEQLESTEDYDYWVKNLSVLSFATVNKILYRYRIHNAQESETNKEKQKQIHLLIVQKHLLKFNIKANLETIKIILNWNNEKFDSHASQKFQEAVRFLKNSHHQKFLWLFLYRKVSDYSLLPQPFEIFVLQ